jgi:hypothetical protein
MERTYIPGSCNLSDAEARMRSAAGWVGVIVTLLLIVFFVYVPVLPVVRLVVFFPAVIGAIGFLQSAMHFCVSFGMSGLFNMGSEVGKTETVTQADFRAKDKQKAISIIMYALFIGVIVAVVAYFI